MMFTTDAGQILLHEVVRRRFIHAAEFEGGKEGDQREEVEEKFHGETLLWSTKKQLRNGLGHSRVWHQGCGSKRSEAELMQ